MEHAWIFLVQLVTFFHIVLIKKKEEEEKKLASYWECFQDNKLEKLEFFNATLNKYLESPVIL